MKTFAEKLKDGRSELGITQDELGKMVGLSRRTIQAYEQGQQVHPRQGTALKLAKALKVSVRFLVDDECENPLEDIEQDGYIEQARERYGSSAGDEIRDILDGVPALFAGGELSMDEKTYYFDAIMAAYVKSKEEARKKFSRKLK